MSCTIAGDTATAPLGPVPPRVTSPARASTSRVSSISACTSTPLIEAPSTITGGGVVPSTPCWTVVPVPSSAMTVWLPVSQAMAAPKPAVRPALSPALTIAPEPATSVIGASSVAWTTTLSVRQQRDPAAGGRPHVGGDVEQDEGDRDGDLLGERGQRRRHRGDVLRRPSEQQDVAVGVDAHVVADVGVDDVVDLVVAHTGTDGGGALDQQRPGDRDQGEVTRGGDGDIAGGDDVGAGKDGCDRRREHPVRPPPTRPG